MSVPVVETERLVLRGFREDDLDGLAAIVADERVMSWIADAPLDRDGAWRRLAYLVGHWELRGFGPWAVEVRASGALAGHVGLYRPEGWPDLEVGWTLGAEFWGNGYATEAARAAVDWAFAELRAPRVVSLIAPANERSAAVAQRLGMTRSGEEFEAGGRQAEVWELLRPE